MTQLISAKEAREIMKRDILTLDDINMYITLRAKDGYNFITSNSITMDSLISEQEDIFKKSGYTVIKRNNSYEISW